MVPLLRPDLGKPPIRSANYQLRDRIVWKSLLRCETRGVSRSRCKVLRFIHGQHSPIDAPGDPGASTFTKKCLTFFGRRKVSQRGLAMSFDRFRRCFSLLPPYSPCTYLEWDRTPPVSEGVYASPDLWLTFVITSRTFSFSILFFSLIFMSLSHLRSSATDLDRRTHYHSLTSAYTTSHSQGKCSSEFTPWSSPSGRGSSLLRLSCILIPQIPLCGFSPVKMAFRSWVITLTSPVVQVELP